MSAVALWWMADWVHSCRRLLWWSSALLRGGGGAAQAARLLQTLWALVCSEQQQQRPLIQQSSARCVVSGHVLCNEPCAGWTRSAQIGMLFDTTVGSGGDEAVVEEYPTVQNHWSSRLKNVLSKCCPASVSALTQTLQETVPFNALMRFFFPLEGESS